MQAQFKLLNNTRGHFIKLAQGLTIAQLNQIPNGCTNNIAWNLGHILASQSGLCYRLAGVPTLTDKDTWSTFKIGTKPERLYTQAEVDSIIAQLQTTAVQMEQDYNNGVFKTYTPYVAVGFELNTIEDAITYNNIHEAYHYGVASAIKKLV
jgi:hypothetical protein